MKPDTQIKMRLSYKGSRLGLPISGTFELTPCCNFHCRMCYVRRDSAPVLPAEQWIDMGRQATEAGMMFLLITGGEPFLRPDFPEIYRALYAMGLSISINTNGSLLNDKLRALFTELPPAQVNVTLYGPDRETYGAICRNPAGYDAAVDALEWLPAHHIVTNMNVTATPWNIDKYDAMADFAKKRGLNLRLSGYNFPPVRRENGEGYDRLGAEETGILLAHDELVQKGIDGIHRLAEAIRKNRRPEDSVLHETGDPMQCFAGRSQFWISWNGDMVPCGMLNEPIAHPFRDGFKAAWEQTKLNTSRIRLAPECVDCPDHKTCACCAAVTSAETGRFDGFPEYMCRLNRTYRAEVVRLDEENQDAGE